MQKLKRAPNSKTTLLPDGYVAIFAAPTGRAYTLPPLGAIAWEFFDGEHSTQDIVSQVATAIGSEETAELRQQILSLTEELERNGYLEKC